MVIQDLKMVCVYAIPGLKDRIFLDIIRDRNIDSSEIVRSVCEYFNKNERDIKKKSRKQENLYPRQCAMYLMRKYTKMTLKQIGDEFDYGLIKKTRDHTTAIHSINTIQNYIDTEDKVKNDIRNITEIISSGMTLKTLKDVINEI